MKEITKACSYAWKRDGEKIALSLSYQSTSIIITSKHLLARSRAERNVGVIGGNFVGVQLPFPECWVKPFPRRGFFGVFERFQESGGGKCVRIFPVPVEWRSRVRWIQYIQGVIIEAWPEIGVVSSSSICFFPYSRRKAERLSMFAKTAHEHTWALTWGCGANCTRQWIGPSLLAASLLSQFPRRESCLLRTRVWWWLKIVRQK